MAEPGITSALLSVPPVVMVVDDDPISLRILSQLLAVHGHEIMAASSGGTALTMSRLRPPDLVLLDICMPDMDGYETCRAFKEQHGARDIPVVFVSALEEPLDKVKAFRAGGVDYVNKPFNDDEVLARCNTHLSLSRARRDLQSALGRAEAAVKARTELLATLSHEIRTPLHGILGLVRMLRGSAVDEGSRDCLETVGYSGGALLSLLDNILDLSRLEAGGTQLEMSDFDPRRMVGSAVALLFSRAREKGLTLSSSLHEHLPERIHADAGRIRQVLLNLLGNAVKFTERGCVKVDVTYCDREDPASRCLEITVSDTGIGLDIAARERIFKAYAQADTSISRRFGGTGLGLNISRRLAMMMGGSLTLESNVGQGSVFLLRVPVQPAKVPAHDASVPKHAPRRPLRLLVADDESVNQTVARVLLEELGHTVVLVCDGGPAVEHATQGGFDAVLLDIQMNQMSGIEAAKRIRALPGAAGKVPLIALTGYASHEDIHMLLNNGLDAVLTKPFSQEALEAMLETHTRRVESHESSSIIPLAPAPFKPIVIPPADASPSKGSGVLHRTPTPAYNGTHTTAVNLNGVGVGDEVSPVLAKLKVSMGDAFESLRERSVARLRTDPLRIAAAARTGEWRSVAQITHRLNGLCGTLGLMALRTLLEALEQECSGGRVADAARLIDLMPGRVERAIGILERV